MKRVRAIAAGLTVVMLSTLGWAIAGGDLVKFLENYG